MTIDLRAHVRHLDRLGPGRPACRGRRPSARTCWTANAASPSDLHATHRPRRRLRYRGWLSRRTPQGRIAVRRAPQSAPRAARPVRAGSAPPRAGSSPHLRVAVAIRMRAETRVLRPRADLDLLNLEARLPRHDESSTRGRTSESIRCPLSSTISCAIVALRPGKAGRVARWEQP